MMVSGLQEALLDSKALNLVLKRDDGASPSRTADQPAPPGQRLLGEGRLGLLSFETQTSRQDLLEQVIVNEELSGQDTLNLAPTEQQGLQQDARSLASTKPQLSDEVGFELLPIEYRTSHQDDPEQGRVDEELSDQDTLNSAPTEQQVLHQDDHEQGRVYEELSDEVALKLIVAVVCGNLLVTDDINPREEIVRELITYTSEWEVRKKRLLGLMFAQSNFGQTIGVPVVFYLGAFIYTIIDLRSNPSDKNTAISLAFGIEW
jgi:hypothetical protein